LGFLLNSVRLQGEEIERAAEPGTEKGNRVQFDASRARLVAGFMAGFQQGPAQKKEKSALPRLSGAGGSNTGAGRNRTECVFGPVRAGARSRVMGSYKLGTPAL